MAVSSEAEELIDRSLSDRSRDSYRRQFEAAIGAGFPWPASTEQLIDHLAELHSAGRSASSIRLRRAAIAAAARGALRGVCAAPSIDARDARLRLLVRGVERDAPPARAAAPMRAAALRACVDACEDDRDRALLLLGWTGALRRPELARLRHGDVGHSSRGLELSINGKGGRGVVCVRATGGAYCPALAYARLPARAGRVFELSDSGVAYVVRKWADAAGFAGLTCHSMRSGWATEAAESGVPIEAIAAHLRHKSVNTTRIYTRSADAWRLAPPGLVEVA